MHVYVDNFILDKYTSFVKNILENAYNLFYSTYKKIVVYDAKNVGII